MIFKIKQWLTQAEKPEEHITREKAITLLLYEAATADYEFDDQEKLELLDSIAKGLNISSTQADELLEWAITQSQLSTSLYPFTSSLNQSLSIEEKTEVMRMLWRIAFSDKRLDKYEEHYIRHIADLLYVPHSIFIETKLAAEEALS